MTSRRDVIGWATSIDDKRLGLPALATALIFHTWRFVASCKEFYLRPGFEKGKVLFVFLSVSVSRSLSTYSLVVSESSSETARQSSFFFLPLTMGQNSSKKNSFKVSENVESRPVSVIVHSDGISHAAATAADNGVAMTTHQVFYFSFSTGFLLYFFPFFVYLVRVHS